MEKELLGSYPIVIDDRETGTINVTREGLFWCFEATSEPFQDMVRLSVYGDDGEGYLGIMEPKDGFLRLRKKLSRSALSAFPSRITHGGRQGMGRGVHIAAEPWGETPAETITAGTEGDGGEISRPEDGGRCAQQEASEADRPAPGPSAPPLVWRPCGCPCSHLSSVEAKQVFGSRKNVLEASDGEFIYLALPEDSELTPDQQRLFPGVSLILGRRHLVCRVKNGRIT